MTDNSRSNNSRHPERENASAPAKRATGQQTGGKRNQKADRKDEEHYRSSEQKKQKGNHGGNR